MNTSEPITANAAEAAPAHQAAVLPAAPSANGISFLAALLLAAACSSVSGYASWRLGARAQPPVQVVVFDAERVAAARMEKALAAGVSSGDAAAEGQKFITDLNAELSRYSQAGIVVVNSSVALNRPEGLDITRDVAASLGVDLK